MNILVTGANGQLGRSLRRVSAGSGHKFFFSDVAGADGLETIALDVTDEAAVCSFVAQNSIDAIINCAAWTNVDAAESHPAEAELLNACAPALLARALAPSRGFLVHVSTDYVFDGEAAEPYSESAVPAPKSVYGSTKLAGEKAVLESGCRYMIVRTAWLYSEYGKNFCKTMLDLAASRPELKVVSDQIGTPTYAGDLAEAILKMIESPEEGVYHFTDMGSCSWYEFACEIARLAGRTGCEIKPCTSAAYPSPVKRPAYSVLDKTKIQSTFGLEIPEWRESLAKCIKNITEGTWK